MQLLLLRRLFELMISRKGHDISCPYSYYHLKSGCLEVYGAGDYAAAVGAGDVDGL
jgi:hypothetical protein